MYTGGHLPRTGQPLSVMRAMVTTQVYTGSDAQKGCGVTDLAVAAGVTHASWVQDGGV